MKHLKKRMLIMAVALLTVGAVLTTIGVMMGGKTIVYGSDQIRIENGSNHIRAHTDTNSNDTKDVSASKTVQESSSTEFTKKVEPSSVCFENIVGNLEILSGDKWELKYRLTYPERLEQEWDGTELTIRYDNGKSDRNIVREKITLILPKNMVLDELDIKAGIGNVLAENIKVNSLDIEGGVGNIELTGVTADELSYQGGVGKMAANDITVRDVDVQVGMGKVDLDGQFTETVDIEGGVGEININCQKASKEDYNFDIKTSVVGQVVLNGEKVPMGEYQIDSEKEKEISVEAGIGKIEIDFQK